MSSTGTHQGPSSHGQIIRHVMTLGMAQVLTWVGSAVMTVLLPRYLGDVNLGKVTFALALTNLVGLVADLGATTYLTREVAREPSRAGRLTVNLFAMRVPLSLVLTGATVVYAHLANYDSATQELISMMSLIIVVTALNSVVTGTLQGLQKMNTIAITSVVSKVGYAILAAILLFAGGGAMGVSIAWVSIGVVTLIYGLFVLFRNVHMELAIDFRTWRTLLLAGTPFFVWQAALIVYGQIDTIMLSFLTNEAVIGWYAVAYRIVMIPVFIPTIVMTVVFPALSAATRNPSVFSSIARRAVHVVALVSIPMALGIMLLPDKIIHLFGYPVSFENSTVPLALLAPHLPLAAIDTMIGTVLNARDRQRQWALTGVAAAVLNPALNLFAIPYAQATWGNGAIGAAAVTTFTEVFMMVGGLRLLPPGVFSFSTISDVARCVAAGLAMVVAVTLTRDMPIVVPIALGALVYTAAALGFGAVSLGDLKQVHVQLLRSQPASSPSI